MSAGWLILLAVGGLAIAFAGVYVFARRIDNYGVVDVAWSYAFGALVVFYAAAGPGWWVRRALLAALVLAWSTRLGTHLWRRVAAHHPEEDGRYGEMRRTWAGDLARRMFVFFQFQALSVVVLGVPFLVAVLNPAPRLHPLEIAGALVWLFAWIGESVADAQLARFKRDPANRGRVCAVGLWRYSRHPNYFCEWLIWVGFFLFGCGSPWGWTGILAPAAILYLLLRVTGVPPTEAQSLRSRGDAYRRYQATTNAFFPWFPRDPAKRAPA